MFSTTKPRGPTDVQHAGRVGSSSTVKALSAFAIACVVGLLAPRSASAQIEYSPDFDPEQFTIAGDPDSVGLLEGGRPLANGELSAGLILRLGGPPLQVCVRDNVNGGCMAGTGDLVSTRFNADLAASYGFGRFSVRAVLPVVLHQGTDFDPAAGNDSLSSAGLADLRLGGKVRIYEVADIVFAYDASFNLPFTGGSNFIGDSGLTLDQRALADWRRDRFSAAASIGYRWRQDDAQVGNLYVNDEFLWSVAGEYQVQPNKLSVGLAIFGRIGVLSAPDSMTFTSSPSSEERPAEVLASGRYWLSEKLALEGGVGTGLSSGYGAPSFRVLAGVRWIDRNPVKDDGPLVMDRDGDGIIDSDDKCPNKAEDKDDFEDTDGCPDDDNDQDNISDVTDKCPNKAEDMDGFEDSDGCPDDDNDKDGVADATDKCPMDAEDMDGFEDEDGCPDTDNDKDGIADATDKCPNKAEDMDGFGDEDGCPEDDFDGDGIADTADKCPTEKEVYNGIEDEDGCPDQGRTIVTLTSSGIEIGEIIYFSTNKAVIRRRSYKTLDVVATVLKAHSTLRMRVEGHTDDRGSDEKNMTLSQNRAESVMKYLVDKGIDASRLEAKGFGKTRPVAEGRSRAQRRQNRRVEFVIIGGEGAGVKQVPPTP